MNIEKYLDQLQDRFPQSLNGYLQKIGSPINAYAETNEMQQGDPGYFITDLPFELAFPPLTQLAQEKEKLSSVLSCWQEQMHSILDMFITIPELKTVPVWEISELELAKDRSDVITNITAAVPNGIFVLSSERTEVNYIKPDSRIDTNRVIPVTKTGKFIQVIRNDTPSYIAERPGKPNISDQLTVIVKKAQETQKTTFLLTDTGIASGSTMNRIASWLKQNNLDTKIIVGGLGWNQKITENLNDFSVICAIRFDLTNGGWIETRDFFPLPQTGILIADLDVSGIKLFQASVSGIPIGFTIPDIAFGGRWFRLQNIDSVRCLQQKCLQGASNIFDALGNPTIGELAQTYQNQGALFTLPMPFGNLPTTISGNEKIIDYLQRSFSK